MGGCGSIVTPLGKHRTAPLFPLHLPTKNILMIDFAPRLGYVSKLPSLCVYVCAPARTSETFGTFTRIHQLFPH